MDEVKLPFDSRKQSAVLGHLIENETFFLACMARMKAQWFNDSRLVKIYQLVSDWWVTYRRRPTLDEIRCHPEIMAMDVKEQISMKSAVESCSLEKYNFMLDALRREMTEWLGARIFRESVDRAVEKYNQGDFQDAYSFVDEKIDEIRSVKFEEDEKVSFLNPHLYLVEAQAEYENAVTTGLKIFDDALVPSGDSQGKGGLFRGDTSILLAASNIGKCLGVDTPVMMSDGTVRMVQDIQAGESVMGPDGKPRRVLTTTTGFGPLYRITPRSGGEPWVCNDAHVLSLKGNKDRWNYRRGKITNLSVSEYLQKSNNFKKNTALWRASFEFQHQELPIDPYILGLWLGDGNSHQAALTTMDPPLKKVWVEWCRNNNDVIHTYSRPPNKSSTYATVVNNKNHATASVTAYDGRSWLVKTTNSSKKLRDLGVLNNKHIPHKYKISSRDQRLALLAGIIDTDGYYSGNCFEISTKLKILSEDYAFLARSLGFKVKVERKTKTIKRVNFSGQYYSVYLWGKLSTIPTKLKRKRAQDNRKNAELSGFDIKHIGNGNYYGFTLDGDHLFVLGDFTVTHNTSALITMAIHNAKRFKNVLFLSHEGRPSDLREKMVQSITGLTKPELFEAIQTPEGVAKINRLAMILERFVTYIPYNKADMCVEELVPLIRRECDRKRSATNGTGYDLLVSDYPAKLSTVMAKGGHMSRRNIDDIVYEHFVQLALEQKFHALLAIQTNRTGSIVNREDTRFLTMEDVSESWGPMTSATNVISINRDLEAARNNRVTFFVAKSRSSQTGRAVVCRSNYGACITHSEKLGGVSYMGAGSLSDRIEDLLKHRKGQNVDDIVNEK